jgi:hypothetical protein
MAKIISMIVLVMLVILSPPAVLAYVSQDALPGEMTYPIKRKLEDGILLLVSITPYTKALFAVAQTQRRFEESAGLLKKDASASDSLKELVSQTGIAAQDINNLNNQNQKKEIAAKLVTSINKYNKALEEQGSKTTSKTSATSSKVVQKTSSSKPASQGINPTPNSTNSNQSQNNSQLDNRLSDQQRELDETRNSLEQIKEQLSSLNRAVVPPAQAAESTPTPIPTPLSTPSPSPTFSPAFRNAHNVADPSPTAIPIQTTSPTPIATPSTPGFNPPSRAADGTPVPGAEEVSPSPTP